MQLSEVIFWVETVVILMARIRDAMNEMIMEKCIVTFALPEENEKGGCTCVVYCLLRLLVCVSLKKMKVSEQGRKFHFFQRQ